MSADCGCGLCMMHLVAGVTFLSPDDMANGWIQSIHTIDEHVQLPVNSIFGMDDLTV